MSPSRSPKKPAPRRRPRKDRLIQTRVPADLENTLKEEAERRRLSVSHLIRSILEDTFHLVDDVVSDIDKVVSDSMDLARNVRRNAAKLAAPAPPQAEPSPGWDEGLGDIYGWSELVLQRAVRCRRCAATMERGATAYLGLTDKNRRSRAWLCASCIQAL